MNWLLPMPSLSRSCAALRPIRARLLGNLERIFADPKATDGRRLSAANAFADYAASDIAKLSELLTVATSEQHAVLYPIVAASPAPATVERLGKIAATAPPLELGSVERVPYGQRRANAAVTLLRMGEREKVLPVFEMTDDPEVSRNSSSAADRVVWVWTRCWIACGS